MSDTIGIIGLGLLGSAIADRLDSAGYTVHGYDPIPPENSPARMCASAGEVAAGCRRILFSLPNGEVSAAVVDEIRDSLQAGQIIIDTTTGSPEGMIALAQELARLEVHYVEANVAGSSELLRNKQAHLFVAGDEKAVASLGPLLAELAAETHVLGPAGSASRFKLVHNLILGLHRAVLAEGLQFAEALGFDAGTALSVLEKTPAVSGVMSTKGPRMVERNYIPAQARVHQHLKDVRLIIAQAEEAGARVPLSILHRELLERLEALGLGDADNSAIMEAFNR